MSKKTLVLNDQPMLHLALKLVLEEAGSEVVHLADAQALVDALSEDVRAVVLDLGMDAVDVSGIAAALSAVSPDAGMVLIGPKRDPAPEVAHLLWTEAPYTDRERIAAFVRERCG